MSHVTCLWLGRIQPSVAVSLLRFWPPQTSLWLVNMWKDGAAERAWLTFLTFLILLTFLIFLTFLTRFAACHLEDAASASREAANQQWR